MGASYKEAFGIKNFGNLYENVNEYSDDGLYNDKLNDSFTMSELKSSIKNLKVGNAGGQDDIISELLIDTII